MKDTETYDFIITHIREREVEVPPMTADQLAMWWHGWSACQEQVLNLIERMKREKINVDVV